MAKSKRPLGLVLMGGLALVWNLIGLAMFYMNVTMTPQAAAALPPDQQQIHAAMPQAAYVAFGLAVLAGVFGSLALLLGKRLAPRLFLLSLLAVLVQMAIAYASTPVWELTGAGGAIFPLGLILVALFLWRYADKARVNGWLN